MGIGNYLRTGLASIVLGLSACGGPTNSSSDSSESMQKNISEQESPLEAKTNKEVLRTVYVPDSKFHPEVGKGYDSAYPTSDFNNPYKNIQRKGGKPVPHFVPIGQTNLSFDSHLTEDSFEEAVGLTVGASARYGLISGSGSFCQQKSISFNRRTLAIALTYSKDFGYDEVLLQDGEIEPIFSDTAKKYVENKEFEKFKRDYGTEVISRVNKSAHLVILYRLETNSSQRLEQLRADFKAKYSTATTDVKVSSSFSSWLKDEKRDFSVKIDIKAAGLNHEDEMQAFQILSEDPYNPKSAYDSMIVMLGGKKEDAKHNFAVDFTKLVPTSFATTPYRVDEIHSGVKGDEETWKHLFEKWRDAKSAWSDAITYQNIQIARKNAGLSYVDDKTTDSLVKKGQEYFNTVKTKGNELAETGTIDISGLRMPAELDKVYNYFYADSKDWDMFTWLFLTYKPSNDKEDHYSLITPGERKTIQALLNKTRASQGDLSGGDIGRIALELERRTELEMDATSEADTIYDMTPLLALKNLKYLSLKNQAVRDLPSLERLTELQHLDLSKSEALSSPGLYNALSAPNIKKLTLRGNVAKIYPENEHERNSVIRTLDFFKQTQQRKLEELDIGEQLYLNDIEAVKHLSSLKKLNLEHTGIGDEQLKHLAGLNLEELSLAATRRINELHTLAELKPLADTLKKLDLTLLGGNPDYNGQKYRSDGFAILGHAPDTGDASNLNVGINRRKWVENFIKFIQGKEFTAYPDGRFTSDQYLALRNIFPTTDVTWDFATVRMHGGGQNGDQGMPWNDAPEVK